MNAVTLKGMINPKSLSVLFSIFIGWSVSEGAAPPLWWSLGPIPVIDPEASQENLAPANIGQAKWMAKNALEVLRDVDPDIALLVEADLVGLDQRNPNLVATGKVLPYWYWNSLSEPTRSAEQYAPLMIGQLKALSAPFYQRLHEVHPAWLTGERTTNGTASAGTHFPWTLTTDDDDNKSIANIGQLKAVFSLRFESLATDGIPEAWWIEHFGRIGVSTASDDPDGDGLTNYQEYLLGTSPVDIDTDNDGIPDAEDAQPLIPNSVSTSISEIVVLTPFR